MKTLGPLLSEGPVQPLSWAPRVQREGRRTVYVCGDGNLNLANGLGEGVSSAWKGCWSPFGKTPGCWPGSQQLWGFFPPLRGPLSRGTRVPMSSL
jgi:hypothetical protein